MNNPLGETYPEFRVAVRQLRDEFHKVEVTSWDEETERLYVRIYRDKDTIVGRAYYLHNHDGEVYRRDVENGVGPGFPVKQKKVAKTAPRVAVKKRPRRKVAEVEYSDNPTGLTWLFIKRAEIQDEVTKADLEFVKTPNPVNHGILCFLRDRLTQVESQIVDEAGLPLY